MATALALSAAMAVSPCLLAGCDSEQQSLQRVEAHNAMRDSEVRDGTVTRWDIARVGGEWFWTEYAMSYFYTFMRCEDGTIRMRETNVGDIEAVEFRLDAEDAEHAWAEEESISLTSNSLTLHLPPE